jgi:hypothetical protein
MSDSDIHTTVLSSSWAFITIVLNWGTQFVSSLWKESVNFEDCTKSVHSISLRNWETTEQMNHNVELYICTFFNYSQNNWASLRLMTELIINNHDFVSTEMSLFFLSYEYYMKSLQLFEKLKPVWSAKVQYRKLIKLYKRWKKPQSEHR